MELLIIPMHFLQPPVTSSLLGPNFLLSALVFKRSQSVFCPQFEKPLMLEQISYSVSEMSFSLKRPKCRHLVITS
jgi:hypothetical protein